MDVLDESVVVVMMQLHPSPSYCQREGAGYGWICSRSGGSSGRLWWGLLYRLARTFYGYDPIGTRNDRNVTACCAETESGAGTERGAGAETAGPHGGRAEWQLWSFCGSFRGR